GSGGAGGIGGAGSFFNSGNNNTGVGNTGNNNTGSTGSTGNTGNNNNGGFGNTGNTNVGFGNGGNGGAGCTGGVGGTGGISGAVTELAGGIINTGSITAGVGIAATNSGALSVFDSGTIVGTSGTAIDLSHNAGGNTLTLGAGFSISGNVLGSGSDTFQLGGAGSGSFDLGTLGTQYTGFSAYNVVSGTWTVSGTFTQFAPWTVEGGTLIENGTLSDGVTVDNGGTLVLSAGNPVGGSITLNAGSTLEFDTNLIYAGPISIAGAVDFAVAATQTVTLPFPIVDGTQTGELVKTGAGTLVLNAEFGAEAYTGGTVIDAGTLELAGGEFVSGNVTFAGAGATLRLDSANNQIGGSIAGAVAGDAIDLAFTSFATGDQAVWSQTSASAGVLSLVDGNNGATLASLNLTGSFGPQQFAAVGDSRGSTLIEVVPQPPNAPPPSGTSADMIMRDGRNGDLEIYDLGRNTILSAGYLGQLAPEWQVAGLGDFGGDASDILLRNSTTGQFEVYDVSNNNITSTAPMGQVGLEWQVAGFGDFSGGANETDMLMRNSNTGVFEVYDISHNSITSAAPMGQVGLEWQVAGFGDFSGNANETDMLMRNTNTGAFEVYDISHNTITSAAPMGQVGLEWQTAGIAPASLSQLTQAMAAFAPANGALDTTSPLNQAIAQSGTPAMFTANTTSHPA
ncbi:MAG: autotransporter-associated beta strand repeat-containing protein, partial [Xanthobacteraceae bacterium]